MVQLWLDSAWILGKGSQALTFVGKGVAALVALTPGPTMVSRVPSPVLSSKPLKKKEEIWKIIKISAKFY